jgi:hypothetical protein
MLREARLDQDAGTADWGCSDPVQNRKLLFGNCAWLLPVISNVSHEAPNPLQNHYRLHPLQKAPVECSRSGCNLNTWAQLVGTVYRNIVAFLQAPEYLGQFPDGGACSYVDPFGAIVLHADDKSACQVTRHC